jgi:acyl-CoA reductase-like NAD-dependent aldehyde dehydrogenase
MPKPLYAVTDPATGEVLRGCPTATAQDTENALSAAAARRP